LESPGFSRGEEVNYYSVTDADATTQAMERAGGTVRVAPRDLDDWGRMAQYSDPLGGQFAVWQPGKNTGFELADEPGSLSWTELYTSDAAAAKEFYGGVFGWQFSDMELPGGEGTYILITPAGLPEDRMQGGLMEVGKEDLALANERPYWHPVFADCDAAVAKVTESRTRTSWCSPRPGCERQWAGCRSGGCWLACRVVCELGC
jgi:predicted enzyme related to lactoylglutathione lyase